MKMKQKMLLMVLGPVVVMFAGIIVYIGINMNRMGVDTSTQMAAVSGEKIALSVRKEIEGPLEAVRTMAYTLTGMVKDGTADRDTVSTMLHHVLEDNPNMLGTWTG